MEEPYVFVRVGKGKYKREHILVMEQKLGHPIPKGSHVHHINGDTKDNRVENLEVLSASEHRKLHIKMHRDNGDYLSLEERLEKKRKSLREGYWRNHSLQIERRRIYRENHREELREKAKEYRLHNLEKIRERNRAYYHTNKKRIQEQSKKYRLSHQEEIKRKKKEYAIKHRDELREKRRIYSQTHKEQIREKKMQKRRNLTPEQKERLRLYYREYRRKKKEQKREEPI